MVYPVLYASRGVPRCICLPGTLSRCTPSRLSCTYRTTCQSRAVHVPPRMPLFALLDLLRPCSRVIFSEKKNLRDTQRGNNEAHQRSPRASFLTFSQKQEKGGETSSQIKPRLLTPGRREEGLRAVLTLFQGGSRELKLSETPSQDPVSPSRNTAFLPVSSIDFTIPCIVVLFRKGSRMLRPLVRPQKDVLTVLTNVEKTRVFRPVSDKMSRMSESDVNVGISSSREKLRIKLSIVGNRALAGLISTF